MVLNVPFHLRPEHVRFIVFPADAVGQHGVKRVSEMQFLAVKFAVRHSFDVLNGPLRTLLVPLCACDCGVALVKQRSSEAVAVAPVLRFVSGIHALSRREKPLKQCQQVGRSRYQARVCFYHFPILPNVRSVSYCVAVTVSNRNSAGRLRCKLRHVPWAGYMRCHRRARVRLCALCAHVFDVLNGPLEALPCAPAEGTGAPWELSGRNRREIEAGGEMRQDATVAKL